MEFKGRIEELPVMGRFLRDSFTRDLPDFTNFSPIFSAAYKSSFDAKLVQVEGLVSTSFYIKDIKKLTDTLYNDVDKLRPMMTQLEGWVRLAKSNLTILPKDFGIKQVRDKINRKDVEGLLKAVKVVAENVQANATALGSVGATTAAATAVQTLITKIKNENDEQNRKMNLKEEAVQANKSVIDELWTIMTDVMDAGKRLYKYTNKAKLGDYTKTMIMTRIRHEHKKKEEES